MPEIFQYGHYLAPKMSWILAVKKHEIFGYGLYLAPKMFGTLAGKKPRNVSANNIWPTSLRKLKTVGRVVYISGFMESGLYIAAGLYNLLQDFWIKLSNLPLQQHQQD